MKHFMLDIETMGVDPMVDDVIQIGILEVNEYGDYYEPGRAFSRTFHTSQKPNDFIANMHKDLLPVCYRTPMVEPAKVRYEIIQFFRSCDTVGAVTLMGVNPMSLDVPFLLAKGYLTKADFNYRVYDLTPNIELACKLLKLDRPEFFRRATNACSEIQPTGKKHEALYDCYNQVRTLNGMIRLIRATQSQAV